MPWFSTFLESYNGVSIYGIHPTQHQVHLDASLTRLGDDLVCALTNPRGFQAYDMFNVFGALKLGGQIWANQRVHIHCDNIAVVKALTFGKAWDSILAISDRNVWMFTALFNISLVVTHIPDAGNAVADLLTRWQGTASCLNKLHEYISCPIRMQLCIDHILLN